MPAPLVFRRRALVAALGLALAVLAQPVAAAPQQPIWEIIDLGDLPGGANWSEAWGINNQEQVVGGSAVGPLGSNHPFLWQGGAITDLAAGNASLGQAWGINDSGHVVGQLGNRAFWRTPAGTLTTLAGPSGGVSTAARAIDDRNFAVGFGLNDAGIFEAMAWNSPSSGPALLGTAPDGLTGFSQGFGVTENNGSELFVGFTSGASPGGFIWENFTLSSIPGINQALDINDNRVIIGNRQTGSGIIGVTVQNGFASDLPDLPGGITFGTAHAVNENDLIVGYGYTAAGQRATLWNTQGQVTDLSEIQQVKDAGWTLLTANDINDNQSIVGRGVINGVEHAYLLRLAGTTVNLLNGSFFSWDNPGSWAYGIAPSAAQDVYLDTDTTSTVIGPSGTALLRNLYVGGGNGTGSVTLFLNGGKLVVGGGFGAVELDAQAKLSGTGAIEGYLYSFGELQGATASITQGFYNNGRMIGGRVDAGFVDNYGLISGSVQIEAVLFNGASTAVTGIQVGEDERSTVRQLYNNGRIEVRGGELAVSQDAVNYSNGTLQLRNATLRAGQGLTNFGQINVSFGVTDVFGPVIADFGGRVVLTGNSQTTFYDLVDIREGSELRVSTGSAAVFFGQVLQRTGSFFTGAGTKFYEGGLSVGSSPGLGADAGDVSFGTGNVYLAEIGGTAPGDAAGNGLEFDRYVVTGELSLGGTLKLVSWDGFVGQAGDTFDLFDWGTLTGTFDAIDSSGFSLAAGTALDFSTLYSDGAIRVAAVPEPEAYALLLAGLGLVGAAVRRRRTGRL